MKSQQFRCDECDISWTNKTLLNRHFIYGANHALTCYLCNITFEHAQQHNEHVTNVHERKCNLCNNRIFKDSQLFKHHVIALHKPSVEESSEESSVDEDNVTVKNKVAFKALRSS